MVTTWLIIIFFLLISQYGNAAKCYEKEKTCYLDYKIAEGCTLDCFSLSNIVLMNVPDGVLSVKTFPELDIYKYTNLALVGNISSVLDILESPLDQLQNLNITGSDLSNLYISNSTITTLTIMDTQMVLLTLRRQDKLKTIKISRNSLRSFTARILVNLPKAEHLDLSVNEISIFGGAYQTDVNGTDLVLNPNMRFLNLSYNQMVFLYNETFGSMPNLKVLDLSHNLIEDLTNEPFSKKFSLVELYLSYNDINVLSVSSFEKLFSLKVLYLDHNKLPFLTGGIFSDLKNLSILDISFNNMFILKSEALFALTSLTQLNLESNRLKEFDLKVLTTHLRFITSLNIKDNQLTCKNLRGQLIPNSVIRFSQGNCFNRPNHYGICCSEDTPKQTKGVDNSTNIARETNNLLEQIHDILQSIQLEIIILGIIIIILLAVPVGTIAHKFIQKMKENSEPVPEEQMVLSDLQAREEA